MKLFIKALKKKKRLKKTINKTITSKYTFSIKPMCVSGPPTEYKLALKFMSTFFHRLILSIIMSTIFG